MKVASGPLIAYLNSGSVFQMALLYTITLLGGGVYRWTSADLSIVFGGNTFTSAIDQGGQPLIQRGPIRTVKGLEVDTLDITLLCGDTAQILGGNLTLAAHNGAFDGARVKVERLFMPSWGDTSLGSLVEFEGAVAGVDPASQQVILHVMSDLEKLQLQMPHVLFMPACANSFGDPACGIVLSTLTATGTAGASTNASQVTNVTGHVDGYYNLGVIAMTSGPAAGSRRSVRSYLSSVVVPAVPFPIAPASGDGFSIYPGCQRTQTACAGWSNSNRFRGCPYVPMPETTR